jgi:hypothetical protein
MELFQISVAVQRDVHLALALFGIASQCCAMSGQLTSVLKSEGAILRVIAHATADVFAFCNCRTTVRERV